MDRRISQIPRSEWGDMSIDLTPREYVVEYLRHAFPTQLRRKRSAKLAKSTANRSATTTAVQSKAEKHARHGTC